MLLAARREDADTLFFQRRLRMSGDTELGLYLKNFLDAFEPPARWVPLTRALDRMAGLRFPGR
jgi:predicted lipid carrier protein YhbT